jgi:hypothetical protein
MVVEWLCSEEFRPTQLSPHALIAPYNGIVVLYGGVIMVILQRCGGVMMVG